MLCFNFLQSHPRFHTLALSATLLYLDTPRLDTLRLDILRLDILRVAETRLMAFQSRHHRLLAIHFRPLGGSVVPLESFFVAEKTVRVRPLRLAVGAIGEKEIHELRLPDRTA